MSQQVKIKVRMSGEYIRFFPKKYHHIVFDLYQFDVMKYAIARKVHECDILLERRHTIEWNDFISLIFLEFFTYFQAKPARYQHLCIMAKLMWMNELRISFMHGHRSVEFRFAITLSNYNCYWYNRLLLMIS